MRRDWQVMMRKLPLPFIVVVYFLIFSIYTLTYFDALLFYYKNILVLRYFFQFDSLYVFPLFFVIFIFSIVTWFFFKAFWLFILISLNDRIVRIPNGEEYMPQTMRQNYIGPLIVKNQLTDDFLSLYT